MSGSFRELPCWEITKCASEDCCLYRRQEVHTKPCWEVAGELDDYRSALNVCKDCIVYVSKEGCAELSREEVAAIINNKVECVLMNSCPELRAGRRAG